MFFQKAMCSAIIPVCALWTGALVAGDSTMDYAALWKVPDLSPHLTHDEVSKEFTAWAERAKKVALGVKPDFAAIFSTARTRLGTMLPQVKGIILYSLFPTDVPNLRQDEAGRADELEKLPRFHDFPILGQLNIDDVAQANRWVDFLRDQILPGGFFACDFMPRHGFRLKTADGDIDILMCYSCDQLAYFGPTKLDSEHNPVFSSATMAQINQLFDKLKIQRDIPPKTKG